MKDDDGFSPRTSAVTEDTKMIRRTLSSLLLLGSLVACAPVGPGGYYAGGPSYYGGGYRPVYAGGYAAPVYGGYGPGYGGYRPGWGGGYRGGYAPPAYGGYRGGPPPVVVAQPRGGYGGYAGGYGRGTNGNSNVERAARGFALQNVR